jgi:hypothetical protein
MELLKSSTPYYSRLYVEQYRTKAIAAKDRLDSSPARLSRGWRFPGAPADRPTLTIHHTAAMLLINPALLAAPPKLTTISFGSFTIDPLVPAAP